MKTPAKNFSVVLFDLGRVLVNIDFDAFPRSLGIDRKSAGVTDRTAVEKMVIEYETGLLTTEQFLSGISDIFRHRFSREQLLNAWNAIIVDENISIAPLVKEVQARYATAVLSNTSPTHIEKAIRVSASVRSFSRCYVSYQIGALKPNPAVYSYVIRDLDVDAASILFIDDISENILAAREAGMEGIVFRDVAQLRRDLSSLQIL